MDGVADQDVAKAASSTVTTDPGADPSAGTQNTDQPANGQDKLTPFHLHPDWQRMVQKNRTYETQNRELATRLQQLEDVAKRSAPTNGSARDPERVAAAKALRELIAEDPDLKGLLDATKHGEELTLLRGALGQYMQREQQGWVRTGREAISAFATTNKLSEAAGKRLEGAVLGQIVAEPELLQRARTGDMTAVVKELLDGLDNDVFKTLRRADAAALVETKNAASRLPPRSPAGSPSGPAAPVKVTVANEQEVRAGMREKLRGLLMSGAEG